MPAKKQKKKVSSFSLLKKTLFFLAAAFGILSAITLFFFLPREHYCANSISCIKDLTGTFQENQTVGQFMGHTVTVPGNVTQELLSVSPVLGAQTQTQVDKHIYVNLTTQHLFATENNRVVYDFPISSGKWHPTPTGNFKIWIKLYATRMTGGEGDDYYDLPNVPWVMFFAGDGVSQADGFSIHGAYWHNNFGHPMSHGCINMTPEDAKTIFDWATPNTTGPRTYATDQDAGTPITIYGTAPDQ